MAILVVTNTLAKRIMGIRTFEEIRKEIGNSCTPRGGALVPGWESELAVVEGIPAIANGRIKQMFKLLQLKIKMNPIVSFVLLENYRMSNSCLLEGIEPIVPHFHFMFFGPY